MTSILLPTLPILEALPALRAALSEASGAVLQAPPGAGKSTVVPLALLNEGWLANRKILMLEPRRLAARAVATRMAHTLGEQPGGRVGYRVRLDTRVGPTTCIEVITEGILTRLLQEDPALEGVGLVIFDEFHERSLQADLALALSLDTQRNLAEHLKLLVMSATLDGAAVAQLLGQVPIITSAGRMFPVELRYAKRVPESLERDAAASVRRALIDDAGDVLVFLPGAPEIRRVQRLLNEQPLGTNVDLMPLYGDLGLTEQDRALQPSSAGRRKVVLATNIAETSLTIEGVRVVIDGGSMRRARFDPTTGMTALTTVRISRANAEQRRGRAGRLEPGVCYRLWTEDAHRALAAQSAPEILEADLAPLALELARWGSRDAAALAWLDPPPAPALAQARELLQSLGALDTVGGLTVHGREMAALSLHPRLAHMCLAGKRLGYGHLATDIAALLTERDVVRSSFQGRDCDLRTRLELLHREGSSATLIVDRAALQRATQLARQWSRDLRLPPRTGTAAADVAATGLLLAYAYPDRIARSRGNGSLRYVLSNGRGATFSEVQTLSSSEFLVIPELDASDREARIFLAAPISRADIEEHFGAQMTEREQIAWDSREAAVIARRSRSLGALLIDERPLQRPDADRVAMALLQGIRELGIEILPWNKATRQLQSRIELLWRSEPQQWPASSDDALLASLDDWLLPWLDGYSRRDHLTRLDLHSALLGRLSYEQQRMLNELAPTHMTVPSGSSIAIDYSEADPVLAVRLQELFGLHVTPSIARGRVPLTLRLLSPAGRPVQVTRDLVSFWQRGYAEVKKELKGRYPKHYWPDDPYQAEPTARARPRR